MTENTAASDNKLASAAAAEKCRVTDRSEFEEIARESMQRLYAHAAVITGSKQDAEDAAADAIYRLLIRKKPFESREHAKAWLIRVTVNGALKMKNRQRRFSGEDSAAENLSVEFEYPEQSEVMEAVMKLDSGSRAVIMLFYFEDYSVKEIGRILKISPSAVTSRLSRARGRLKEMLKGDYFNE
ncbi:MAG: sigma-70 family RNA polymerase sigma factor [Oscillospiraceae bacterium]|nr:sigma-70 family RNA polymerase sigma factor [Oscillospiraceae bacterium]